MKTDESSPSRKQYDVGALRAAEFPWAARGDAIYLNHASTGPLPRRTADALHTFNELRSEPHRISQDMLFGVLDRGRDLISRLVGASPREIALMVNTGYGINLAARALPLQPGDVVVTSDREFPANIYPWMALEAERGVRLRIVPCIDGLPDEEALLAALDEPGVRVLALSWVSFASGYRVDLTRFGRACRERGIYFVVDAIQGLGAATLDLSREQIDVLACGAQKWLLSPWGTGFVYVREALIEQIAPNAVSWMAVRGSEDFNTLVEYDFTYRDDARRFEMVTLPFQAFAGMNASLELLHELGPGEVAGHIATLAGRMVRWADDREGSARGVRLVTPADSARRAGIVSLALANAPEVSARLTAKGVVHSLREGTLRFSPHAYTTADEIDRTVEML